MENIFINSIRNGSIGNNNREHLQRASAKSWDIALYITVVINKIFILSSHAILLLF